MGLQPGTLRVEIEGEPVILGGDVVLAGQGIRLSKEDGRERIQRLVSDLSPGQELSVIVLRAGKTIELSTVPVPR